jgi:hypothetical protein
MMIFGKVAVDGLVFDLIFVIVVVFLRRSDF